MWSLRGYEKAEAAASASSSLADFPSIVKSSVDLRLNVHVGSLEFVLNTGKGEQNMKWLALVSAQRYRLLAKRKGVIRQQGAAGRPIVGAFCPKGISSEDTETDPEFLLPHILIRDVFRDGEHVFVHLDLQGKEQLSGGYAFARVHDHSRPDSYGEWQEDAFGKK